MRLVDGAHAIRGDLPAASTVVVDVPLEAGESQGSGVARLTSLQVIRDRQTQALAGIDGWALTIGGDCGVELAAVSRVSASPDVALVWFDAHPDAHTPESSDSSAFHGMVVRTLIGEGDPGLVPADPLPADRVFLVGTRSFDDAEDAWARESGIRTFSSLDVTPDALADAIAESGATEVYLHVDLDVLDPGEFGGLGYPEPFGIATADLTALIRALTARFEVVGAGVTEFAPPSEEQASDDLPTVLRIIGALTSK
jgi:arginase